jgi:hypothetical protein
MGIMDTGTHSPSTKSGRAVMAKEILDIANMYGAEFTYEPGYWGTGKDLVSLKLNGIGVFFDIRKEMFSLVHWHIKTDDIQFSPAFHRFADVNRFHHQKATAYPRTWGDLKGHLHAAFTSIKTGEGIKNKEKA